MLDIPQTNVQEGHNGLMPIAALFPKVNDSQSSSDPSCLLSPS